jgi:hypothetical protein
MATTTHSDKETIIQIITEAFAGLGPNHKPPLSRELIYEPGQHVVPGRLDSLGEAYDLLDKSRADPSAVLAYFRLKTSDPEPEVFIYEDKMAAAWLVVEQVIAADNTVKARSYCSILLVKPDTKTWKISGWARTALLRPSGPALNVDTALTPQIERLLGFPQAMLDARDKKIIPDWLVPGMCMLRQRPGDEEPKSAPVEVFMDQQLAALPVGVQFHEDYEDMTVRTADGLGMIWMKFQVIINGQPQSHGLDILYIVEDKESKDGRWLIAGAHTYSYPPEKKA